VAAAEERCCFLYSYKSTCFTSTRVQILTPEALRKPPAAVLLPLSGGARKRRSRRWSARCSRCRFAQFTCFTSTKVQILRKRRSRRWSARCSRCKFAQFTCFTSTKVHILRKREIAAMVRGMEVYVGICTFVPEKQVN